MAEKWLPSSFSRSIFPSALLLSYYSISTSKTLWQSRRGMQISHAAMKHCSETVCRFLKLVPGLLPSHLGSKWACVATRGSSLAAGWEKPLWGKAKETEAPKRIKIHELSWATNDFFCVLRKMHSPNLEAAWEIRIKAKTCISDYHLRDVK